MTAPRPDVRPPETARQNSTVHRPDPVGRPAHTDPTTRPSTPGVFDGSAEPPVCLRARPRPSRPHRHLTAFAIALPTSGLTGVFVGVLDMVSTVAAAIIPVSVLAGVMVARLLLARLWAWVRAVAAVVAGWYR